MNVLPTVERLKLQAARASDISRQMAEAKSLRQESNPEGRTDLYMWPTPEQTTEGKAAELIAELYEALTNATSALCSLRKNYEEELGIWSDVSRFIKEGNAALAKASGQ